MTTSSEEYAASGGEKCPACGSYNISSTDPIDLDFSAGVQNIECLHCGAEWTEVWALVAYRNLRTKS